MPEPVLTAIEAYSVAGYDLIPLHRWDARDDKGRERGKSPRDGGWRDADYALGDVLEWARGGFNVGVRLRDVDLVIDYDPRSATDGEAVLGALELEFGLDLSTAPSVRTGSGGLHFYFKIPAGLRTRNHLREFPGVEFKSLGRQVVAAGSVHPTGVPYTWRPGVPLADAPMAPAALVSAIAKPDAEAENALRASSAPAEVSIEEVSHLLSQLRPEEFREHDDWLKLMMACHAGTNGAGVEQFVAWSTSDPLYADHGDSIRDRWRSLTANRAGGVTVASLYWHVLDSGGTLPRGRVEDDFDDLVLGEDLPEAARDLPAPLLERTESGKPKPTMRNAIAASEALGIRAYYDELGDSIRLIDDAGFLRARFPKLRHVLDDQTIVALKAMLAENFGLELPTEKLVDGIASIALGDHRNPLVDYLLGLAWDGSPRIGDWLQRHAGAADTPYARAVGRLLLVGAVARALQPGVKFDTMVVLEGAQGVGKSSLLRVLGAPWTLEGLPHADERDVVDAMRGYWIVEMEELATLQRSEVNQLKAFLSRTSDRARVAYARTSRDFPRRCVFVGTTNDTTYLRDSTGNRRFLPVEVLAVDLVGLGRERDQLWAEAVAAWRADPREAAIALPVELREAAAGEQEARRISDPWEELLEGTLAKFTGDRISSAELLAKAVFRGQAEASSSDLARLAKVMQRISGWTKKAIRSEGRVVKGYVRSKVECCPHNADNHEKGVCLYPGCECLG